MFWLTIFSQTPGKRKKNINKVFLTIQQAVQCGQASGKLYEIFDNKKIRIIDWTEVNENTSGEEFYNIERQMWEKMKDDE